MIAPLHGHGWGGTSGREERRATVEQGCPMFRLMQTLAVLEVDTFIDCF